MYTVFERINEKTGRAVLITVYRPDPDRWTDWRRRKS
jgi:hypothetical protein